MLDEIIAAFATPVGSSGLQVLRVAGPGSAKLCDRIFSFGKLPDIAATAVEENIPSSLEYSKPDTRTVENLVGYQAAFGYIHEIDNPQRAIDQCVLIRFHEHKSYTGEEQVELSIHGGRALRRELLDLVLRAGARLAEAGEFTKWAFMNGKMDLSQAEAVMDLIEADTERQHKAAIRHLQGDTALELQSIKNKVYELLSNLEVDIEYPEYEDFELQSEDLTTGVKFICDKLESIVKSNRKGKVLRDGLQLVLVGEPNVGKSSLLNALSGENRAIVTDIAGTTRDSIEIKIELGGIPLTLHDTAGIRETDDPIEKLGVDRAKDLLANADLLLFVLNPGDKDKLILEIEEFLRLSAFDKDFIIVFNKADLNAEMYQTLDDWDYIKKLAKTNDKFIDFISVSALTGDAIGDLKDLVIEYYENMSGSGASDLILTSKRQQKLIEDANDVFRELNEQFEVLPNDIIAAILRQGLELLAEITGEDVSENMISDIFSRFCIGK